MTSIPDNSKIIFFSKSISEGLEALPKSFFRYDSALLASASANRLN